MDAEDELRHLSSPLIRVCRYREGIILEPSERISCDVRERSGEYIATLLVQSCTTEDEGTIEIVVKNSSGDAKSSTKLSILGERTRHNAM